MVVFGFVEVDHAQAPPGGLALLVAVGDLHAVAQQVVLLAVGRDDGLQGGDGGDLPHRVVVRRAGQTRIQRRQPLPQRALQHDLAVRRTAEQAVRPEVLLVVGVDRFPAELLLQVVRRGLLDEGVLGVGSGSHRLRHQDRHGVPPDVAVPGHHRQPFGLGLGNQEAIEWIPMVQWKVARLLRVVEVQG